MPPANYKRIAAATVPLVSTLEAKGELRVDGVSEDLLIGGLISTATEIFTATTGMCALNETWEMVMDTWPGQEQEPWWDGVRDGALSMFQAQAIDIAYRPLVSITSVKTFSGTNVESTYSAGNYFADTYGGRLVLNEGAQVPYNTRQRNGVVIRFVAGHGIEPSGVPDSIKRGVIHLAAHLYEHRGDDPAAVQAMMAGGFNNLPAGIQMLWGIHRRVRL